MNLQRVEVLKVNELKYLGLIIQSNGGDYRRQAARVKQVYKMKTSCDVSFRDGRTQKTENRRSSLEVTKIIWITKDTSKTS